MLRMELRQSNTHPPFGCALLNSSKLREKEIGGLTLNVKCTVGGDTAHDRRVR